VILFDHGKCMMPSPLVTPDIEIALTHLDEAKKIPRKEDCIRLIREAYAERYLANLGVDSNARCRSLQREVLRRAPLTECQIEGTWLNRSSAIIDRLRIRQPRHGVEDEEEENAEDENSELKETETQVSHSRVGHTGFIKPLLDWTNPYQITAPERSTTRELPFLGGGACAWLPTSETDIDLTHELERLRMQARRRGAAPSSTVDGQAKAPAVMLGALTENRLRELKRKFLLPFASQRNVNGKLVITPWLQRPPAELEVSEHLHRQARNPLKASVDDIKKVCVRLVKGQLPLELLTRQPKPALLESVRAQIQSQEMVRLAGLLSHWLYWHLLGYLHPQEKRLLVISIQEIWAALILPFQETPSGVGFAIPALLLTAKMLVEDNFRSQYEDVFRVESAQLHLIEEINLMCMSLLDVDCTFAHFAALDALSEGTRLWRKLQALLERKQGSVARSQAKTCRTSALLRRALVGNCLAPSDSRTRRLLGKSSIGGGTSDTGPPRSAQDSRRADRREQWQNAALMRAQTQVSRPTSADELPKASQAARRSTSAKPQQRPKA